MECSRTFFGSAACAEPTYSSVCQCETQGGKSGLWIAGSYGLYGSPWYRTYRHGIVRIADTNVPPIVPLAPQVLLYTNTHRCSSPIFWRYPQVLKSYNLQVPLDAQVLYFGGTLTCSSPIFWGTLRSSSPIFWSCTQALMSYCLEIPLGPHVILFEGTFRSSCPIKVTSQIGSPPDNRSPASRL